MPCGYLEPVSAHVQDEEEQVSESAATDLGTYICENLMCMENL